MRAIFIVFLISMFYLSSCNSNKNTDSESNGNNDETIGNDSISNQADEGLQSVTNYKPSHVVVKGYVKGGANANVILDELDIGQINPLESRIVDENGGFIFDIDIPEPGIYQIRFAHANIHLFLRGGTVQVNTTYSNVGNYELIGSPESYHLKEMYLILSEINHQTSSIQERVEKLKKDKKRVKELLALVDSLPIYYDAINKEKSNQLIKFIDRVDTSMVGLLAAFYMDPDENYEFVVKTRNRFATICPNSKFFKQLDDKVAQIVPVGPGHSAPNTVIDDAQGRSIALSKYIGKTVLVYFWASYSEPCRMENEDILAIYNEYKKKGFEVYAISVDEQKDPWLTAIKEDKLSWVNVSNLLGWDDEITQIYRVDELPFLVLIDKEGKIVERGFRAHELRAKLYETLK
ncbi:redoxin domain-containing protein [Bacteroidota bacterium]